MSKHENNRVPTYAFHPEFGFLCPSHELRQNVRVGIAAAALRVPYCAWFPARAAANDMRSSSTCFRSLSDFRLFA